jgi:hypothetical protein
MSSCVSEDSIYLKSSKLPKRRIDGLGLSFRDIAKRGDKIVEEYTFDNLTASDAAIVHSNTLQNQAEIIKIQSKLRRILSNWVNDPNNLTNSNGEYIGDKYGARILASSADGTVLHDVETFCKDIKNNRPLNNYNNNFICWELEQSQHPSTDIHTFATFNQDLSGNGLLINSINYNYLTKKVYKVKSATQPSSSPSTVAPFSPLVYNISYDEVLNEQIQTNNYKMSTLDLHTTRKEFIQASCGRYGYNARRSETTNNFNWYVCRKWGNELFANFGTMFFVRLSYFEFPQS